MRLSFLYLFIVSLIACNSEPVFTAAKTEVKGVVLNPASIDKTKTSIYISKSKYQLSLLQEGKVLKTWKMVLGGNPVDDKLRQGDRCTPEGTFKVRDLYPHRSWSKFIWIDYPNEMSRLKHAKAKANGYIPKDASIGGEVGIHGVPPDQDYWIDEGDNWTLGCVSLRNKDVDELYQYIQVGTPIVIEK